MEIKIGDKSHKTRKPSDLDAALLASTGCNAAETAQQLAGSPSAGRIASALRPFLPDDAPSTPELAHAIAASGQASDYLASVSKLYADVAFAPVTGDGGAAAGA